MHDIVMNGTHTGFTKAYAQSLSMDFDLDLWPSNMVFIRDTLSGHDDCSC